jgi:hypothetical protein
VQLRINQAGVAANRIDALFDLSGNGTVDTVISGGLYTSGTAAIVKLANGWFRVSASILTSSDTSVNTHIYLANAAGAVTYNGDGVSGLYIWGAQYEQTDVPTTLAASAAAVSAVRGVHSLTYPITSSDCVPAVGSFSFAAILTDLRTLIATGTDGYVYNVTGETSRYLKKVAGGLTFTSRYGTSEATETVTASTPVSLNQVVNTATPTHKLYVDLASANTTGAAPNPTGTATALRIGTSAAGTNVFHGFIKSFAFFDRAIKL